MVPSDDVRRFVESPMRTLEEEFGIDSDLIFYWVTQGIRAVLAVSSVVAFSFVIVYWAIGSSATWPLTVAVSISFFAVFPGLVLYNAVADQSITTREASPALISIWLGVVMTSYLAGQLGWGLIIPTVVMVGAAYYLYDIDKVIIEERQETDGIKITQSKGQQDE